MKTNANGLMQAIFLNQAMRIVKYARKFNLQQESYGTFMAFYK